MLKKHFICNMKQKTDREANQDNKSAREEFFRGLKNGN